MKACSMDLRRRVLDALDLGELQEADSTSCAPLVSTVLRPVGARWNLVRSEIGVGLVSPLTALRLRLSLVRGSEDCGVGGLRLDGVVAVGHA